MIDPTLGEKTVEVPVVPVAATAVIPSVKVTVIGDKPSTTVIDMPGNHPNIVQTVITPLVAIVVRFAFMFVKSLLGYLTISMVPPGNNPVLLAMHGMDFYHLLLTGIGLSVAPTAYDLLQSLVTILGKLEQKYPVASGSV
jgi:hypothetical protein